MKGINDLARGMLNEAKKGAPKNPSIKMDRGQVVKTEGKKVDGEKHAMDFLKKKNITVRDARNS